MSKINVLQSFSALLLLSALFQRGSGSQRICGRELSDALDEICWNGYNAKVKKSLQWQEDESSKDVASDLLPYPYADSPFMAKILGDEFNVLTKYRARRQGVYDECCLKACTRNELLSYCS